MDKLKDVEFYSVHNTAGSITYLFSVSAHQHMSEGKCSFSSEGCNIHDRETNHSLQHMQKSKERNRKKIVKLKQVGNGNWATVLAKTCEIEASRNRKRDSKTNCSYYGI